MKVYLCRVVDREGRRLAIRREAMKEATVLRDLDQEGFLVLSVRPAGEEPVRSRRPGRALLLEFTEVLSNLLSGGLGLKDALETARRVSSGELARLMGEVETAVAKGSGLRDALARSGTDFPPLYLGLVAVGERAGDLSTAFGRLAEYLAGRKALSDKLATALVYPVFVLCVAVIGMAGLVLFVLPNLETMVKSLNPAASAVYEGKVANFRGGAALAGLVLTLAATASSILIFLRARNESLGLALDSLLLGVPVLRAVLEDNFGMNFAFAMEMLLAAGLPIEEALEESARVVSNRRYRASLRRVRLGVMEGRQLSESLKSEKVFPRLVITWVAIGEGGHDLAASFARLREHYRRESDKTLSRAAGLAEPALILIVGAILMALIFSFVLPIFTMLGGLL